MSKHDPSFGYEAVAAEFLRVRSGTGADVAAAWAASLPAGGTVLDVGAGSGEPITAALIGAGLRAWAVDAAPSMVAAFEARFPGVPVACEPAQTSAFFGRTFDGVVAVGLVFLAPAQAQPGLIKRMGTAVAPGGRLLFSAPRPVCSWADVLTGQTSESLGAEAYRRILDEAGFDVVAEPVDAGGTQYYDAQKRLGG